VAGRRPLICWQSSLNGQRLGLSGDCIAFRAERERGCRAGGFKFRCAAGATDGAPKHKKPVSTSTTAEPTGVNNEMMLALKPVHTYVLRMGPRNVMKRATRGCAGLHAPKAGIALNHPYRTTLSSGGFTFRNEKSSTTS
jgi:hypothetical protein